MKSGIRSLVAVVIVLTTVPAVNATTLIPMTTEQLVKDAELIFQGIVRDVQYRMSVASPHDEAALPHTFVTFEIERILKGSTNHARLITLRFQGGLYDDGRVLIVEGIPLFEVGDRDILFVRRNGRRLCPIVGWEQGRFRIINGQVFDHVGREMWVTPQQELVRGASVPIEEILTRRIGNYVFRTVQSGRAGSSAPAPIAARRLDEGELASFILDLVSRVHRPNELTAVPAVHSAPVDQPFHVRQLKRAAPRQLPMGPLSR